MMFKQEAIEYSIRIDIVQRIVWWLNIMPNYIFNPMSSSCLFAACNLNRVNIGILVYTHEQDPENKAAKWNSTIIHLIIQNCFI